MNEAAAHPAAHPAAPAVRQPTAFRHVVFPDSAGGYGRALNLTPDRPADVAAQPAPHPPARPVLSAGAESFLRWLFKRARLPFGAYKPETLGRRLPACLRAVRANSIAEARSILRGNPELTWPALGALLIGVTSFFRDKAVFQALGQRVLPDLLRGHFLTGGGRPFRVWSAGCSDGAEVYTVALLLAEQGALARGRCELVGTDCRPEALRYAAAGVFEASAVKGLPRPLLERYFLSDGAHYRVRGDVCGAIRWRRADVLAGAERGPWDLALCRNLAIYLEPRAAAALWAGLSAVVRVGGALVLGKAERPLGVPGLAPDGHCIYRRVAETDRAGA
jgi:chemotaxis protein methyltransferase CheR